MRDFPSEPPGAALRGHLYADWALLLSACAWASLVRNLAPEST